MDGIGGAIMIRHRTRVFLALVGIVTIGVSAAAWRIYAYSTQTDATQADAAIVLGTSAWGERQSPVFRERINHAIALYQEGRISRIIFTGGQGDSSEPPEAVVGKRYAVARGISEDDILTETRSRTTSENLYYAQQVATEHRLDKFLIVSDPLHMKRALLLAKDLGMDAYPSPTPTTMYRSPRSRARFLARETGLYLSYLLRRHFAFQPLHLGRKT